MDAKEMESLLHWAIEHSDPDKLREQAEVARRDEAVKDFVERKKRVQELSDIVSQQPSEAQLMMDNIAVLTDAGSSAADKGQALGNLQVLVEPIDNANDLKVLGGLPPLVDLLQQQQQPELQEGAAYVLGTAASNNAKLVEALLQQHPGAMQQLLQIAASKHEGAANKAMYALGSIVRSPVALARSQFYAQAGLGQLQALLGQAAGAPLRVKAKAINLIADLIEMTANGDDESLETWDEKVMSQFAAAALDMLGQAEELDGKEKALAAMRLLLLRRGAAGRAALEDEGAEAVLREALTELDLLVDGLGGYGDGEGGEGQAGGQQQQQQQQQEEGEEQEASDKDRRMYATYVAHLCADVLHHLSIQHAEL
ncbi:hypothetical protein OEZ85_006580 [Tetradesmus obliquus]|uniref:Nucleotide exchange factor Fes1 domain-containing protein n=1 Tax=Tetradesmus obliquus TaxID=3088 RepID=A0ABY8TXJ1_TETOB|nr:hypothetical protein OEZ85_006580 [Tetradesmus obliquus]